MPIHYDTFGGSEDDLRLFTVRLLMLKRNWVKIF